MHARRVGGAVAAGVAVLTQLPATAATATQAAETPRPGAAPAEGAFVATVEFASLQPREVRGDKCEFTVDGALSFSGTVEGVADGTTTAVIFAPCAEALANPPGTYFDVFAFEGHFTGEVSGDPASGPLRYAGVTRVGGEIDALITLRGIDAGAVLRADAQVGVGGTYQGVSRSRA